MEDMNMKDIYETPEMEIVEFETEDVITTSGVGLLIRLSNQYNE